MLSILFFPGLRSHGPATLAGGLFACVTRNVESVCRVINYTLHLKQVLHVCASGSSRISSVILRESCLTCYSRPLPHPLLPRVKSSHGQGQGRLFPVPAPSRNKSCVRLQGNFAFFPVYISIAARERVCVCVCFD